MINTNTLNLNYLPEPMTLPRMFGYKSTPKQKYNIITNINISFNWGSF